MTSPNAVTNAALPKTTATLTVRIIKSFEYRTQRSLVLHGVNLEATTIGKLKDLAREAVYSQSGWQTYQNLSLDTLKLYTVAHGSKSANLIINLDHDEWIFEDDSKVLADLGFENETEVSLFNHELYQQFKIKPETLWDV